MFFYLTHKVLPPEPRERLDRLRDTLLAEPGHDRAFAALAAERIDFAQTSANFFDVFGIKPQHGRLFLPQDEQAGHAPIAVISHTLWQRRFGSDPAIVGKPITLDGRNYTVAGIAPAGDMVQPPVPGEGRARDAPPQRELR